MSRRHFANSARHYAEDLRKRGDGDFASTERLLTEGLHQYPDNPYLMVYLGNLYRDARRDGEAMDILRRAFVKHSYEQIVVMGFANFLTLKKKFDRAEDVYAHMVFLNGTGDMRLLTALGHMYQISDRMPFAAACFGKASMLSDADDYVRLRYTEIRKRFPAGFVLAEWENVQKRMEDRRGAAIKLYKLPTASPPPANTAKPQDPGIPPGPGHIFDNGPPRP